MKKSGKSILAFILVVFLLYSGAVLSSGSPPNASASSTGKGTVTITREEYDRLQRYSQMDNILQYIENYYYGHL